MATIELTETYRRELNPNNKQREWLERCADLSNLIYVMGVRAYEKRFKTKEGEDRFYGLSELQKSWRSCRDRWKHLQERTDEVPASVQNYAAQDVKRAFMNWWKNGQEEPKPHFYKRRTSFKIDRQSLDVRNRGKVIRFPNIGEITLKERMDLDGDPTGGVSVAQDSGKRWYVCITVEREVEVTYEGGPAVGIDWGLSSFITLSNGETVDAPKPLQKALDRLARWQRWLSRKKGPRDEDGPSNNWKKLKDKINRLHRKIRNKRKDFIEKLTTRLTRRFGAIGVENLAVANMMKNQHISRHIADASPGMFRRRIKEKGPKYGCRVELADQFFPSTQTCSNCGYVREGEDKLPLSQRVYECSKCDFVEDRDVNAAINLKRMVGGVSSEPDASGEEAAGRLFHRCKPASMNEEGSTL